jgi:hypothetical protein
VAELHSIRLIKAYRGYRAGTVIRATPGLADHLVETGAGVRDSQTMLQAERPERAVAGQSVERRVAS